MGACQSNELYSMKTEDIEDNNGALIVKIPFTKTKILRSFSISAEYYDIAKRISIIANLMLSAHFYF